ncbi:MAG: hypothetical protein ACI9UK_000591 [Candidatus Krumholzibacteriia bacterium]|jgi:hypothetical protein
MMGTLQRLLREPLLHFFLAGGLIFLIYTSQTGPKETPSNTIVITAQQIERLSLQFQSVWNHEPTAAELDKVIDEHIREEVYYREALALGLDNNDAVVRQRMRQKIEFLTDVGAQVLDATDAELQFFLDANLKRYGGFSRHAFEQIYLGQNVSDDLAGKSLQLLRTGSQNSVGKRSMLPAELGLSSTRAIDSTFGDGFTAQLEGFPIGEWFGPVTSPYGVHMVRLLAYDDGTTPKLDNIRGRVLRDWQANKAKELQELDYIAREQNFTIEVFGRDSDPEEP